MITINLKQLKDAEAPKEVIEVYKYLSAYKDAPERTKWLKNREKNWDIIENELWDEKEKEAFAEQKQLPVVDNKCVKGVQGAGAIATAQNPEIKFHPIGSSDLYVAELCKRANDLIWTKNEGDQEIYDAVEENKVGGIAFIESYHDENKGIFGKIIFEESDPTNWFWDPHSRKRDLSDTHLIKAILRSKTYIKDRYPDIKEADMFYQEGLKEETHTSTGLTGEDNYAKGDKDKPDSMDVTSAEPENIWEIIAWLVKIKKEDWFIETDEQGVPTKVGPMLLEKGEKAEEKATANGWKHWPRTMEKRVVRHIVGKAIIQQTDDEGNKVDELENPYGEDADGNPVMLVTAIKGQRTRNAYPVAITTYARDLNKVSTKSLMNFLHGAAHLVNSPIVRSSDSKWEGVPGTPGSELIVPIKDVALLPYRLQPGSMQLDQWMILKNVVDEDLYDIYDTPDVMRGKVQKGQENQSGRATLSLQDTAGMMSKPFMAKLEAGMIRFTKTNMALILKHWHRYMWERLIEPDEKGTWIPEEERVETEEEKSPEEQDAATREIQAKWENALDRLDPEKDMGPENIGGVMDLDIELTAGSSMPTNRMAKMEVAKDMVEGGIWPPEIANEFIDMPFKDKANALIKKQQQAMMQAEMMGGRKRR